MAASRQSSSSPSLGYERVRSARGSREPVGNAVIPDNMAAVFALTPTYMEYATLAPPPVMSELLLQPLIVRGPAEVQQGHREAEAMEVVLMRALHDIRKLFTDQVLHDAVNTTHSIGFTTEELETFKAETGAEVNPKYTKDPKVAELFRKLTSKNSTLVSAETQQEVEKAINIFYEAWKRNYSSIFELHARSVPESEKPFLAALRPETVRPETIKAQFRYALAAHLRDATVESDAAALVRLNESLKANEIEEDASISAAEAIKRQRSGQTLEAVIKDSGAGDESVIESIHASRANVRDSMSMSMGTSATGAGKGRQTGGRKQKSKRHQIGGRKRNDARDGVDVDDLLGQITHNVVEAKKVMSTTTLPYPEIVPGVGLYDENKLSEDHILSHMARAHSMPPTRQHSATKSRQHSATKSAVRSRQRSATKSAARSRQRSATKSARF